MSFEWDLIKKRPYYSKFAFAYDRLIVKPIKERSNYISIKLQEQKILPGQNLLDIGCGPGGYSIELSKLGYKVTGVDLSSAQIEQARIKAAEENQQIDFNAQNFLDYHPVELYDAALCRGVLNDITDDNTRDQFFEKVSKILKTNGIFIFDVRDWEKSKEQKLENPIALKEVVTEKGLLKISSEITLCESDRSYSIDEIYQINDGKNNRSEKYSFKMKCWTANEVKDRLGHFGFELVSLKGDYNDDVLAGETVYLVVLAKKII